MHIFKSLFAISLIIKYYTIPYHTTKYHIIPLPYHTIPYHNIPYHSIPYHTMPYHTMPIIPFHTTQYHTNQAPYIERKHMLRLNACERHTSVSSIVNRFCYRAALNRHFDYKTQSYVYMCVCNVCVYFYVYDMYGVCMYACM